MLAIQQAAEQLREEILLPLNQEMKNLLSTIEKAEGNISVAITASTLDSKKLTKIRDSLKDLSSSFSLSSDFNKREGSPKKISNLAGLKSPRVNAQAPTPIKGSFATNEKIARSSSHDKLTSKPKFTLISSSSREVPITRREPLPVAEVVLGPDLLMPNIDDTKFNDFLETELERIKKAFLEDNAPSSSRRITGKHAPSLRRIGDSDLGGSEFTSILAATSRKSTVKKGHAPANTHRK